MITTKCSWPLAWEHGYQEVFSTKKPRNPNRTSTASESAIIGNSPTSSSTARNPKRPHTSSEAVVGCVSTPSSTSANNSLTTKHVVGYNSEWEREYPWLQPVRNEIGTISLV